MGCAAVPYCRIAARPLVKGRRPHSPENPHQEMVLLSTCSFSYVNILLILLSGLAALILSLNCTLIIMIAGLLENAVAKRKALNDLHQVLANKHSDLEMVALQPSFITPRVLFKEPFGSSEWQRCLSTYVFSILVFCLTQLPSASSLCHRHLILTPLSG